MSSAATAQQSQQQSAATQTLDDKRLEGLLNNVLEKTERARGEITLIPRGIDFGNFEGLVRWARYIYASGLAPKQFDSLEKVIVAVVAGRAVGLDGFQSVQNMAIINGRPTIYGDAPLGIARQHPDWRESGFKEWLEGDGDKLKAVCETLRNGATEPKRYEFSVEDAKRAKLWGKDGPWTFYPKRMLMFRARAFCLRDNFGDALKGIGIKEEVDDVRDLDVVPSGPPVGRNRLNDRANGHGHELPKIDAQPEEQPAAPEQKQPEPAPKKEKMPKKERTPEPEKQPDNTILRTQASEINARFKQLAWSEADVAGYLEPYKVKSVDNLTNDEAGDVLADLTEKAKTQGLKTEVAKT